MWKVFVVAEVGYSFDHGCFYRTVTLPRAVDDLVSCVGETERDSGDKVRGSDWW